MWKFAMSSIITGPVKIVSTRYNVLNFIQAHIHLVLIPCYFYVLYTSVLKFCMNLYIVDALYLLKSVSIFSYHIADEIWRNWYLLYCFVYCFYCFAFCCYCYMNHYLDNYSFVIIHGRYINLICISCFLIVVSFLVNVFWYSCIVLLFYMYFFCIFV